MTDATLMEVLMAWCGFAGAWALVAGPLYQGAVELTEVEVDRTLIRSQALATPRPPRVSPWWWLLPPVAYVRIGRAQRAWRERMMAPLASQQRAQFVAYSNKATGWFVVGGGAALIAVKETVDVVEVMGWSDLAALPLAVCAAALALTFTVRRMQQAQRVLHADEAADGAPPAQRPPCMG